MSATQDNDIYATLSEQEREAIRLNDDGSEPEPEETTEEVVDDTPVEEAPTENNLTPDSANDTPSEPEAEAESELPTRLSPEEVAFAPQYQVQGVENYQQVVANLEAEYDTKSSELEAKYENGDLSFAEYRKEERALTRTYEAIRQQLHEANLKADIAAEHSRQAAAQKWELEQSLFFSDKPGNAAYKTDPVLRGALGAQLEILYSDKKNAGKPGIWFLREAGRVLDERFGHITPIIAQSPTKQAEAKLKQAEEALRKRQAAHPTIPKTLAAVPTAEENVDGGDEFAWLDKLKGLEYEKAISRLSEVERERYMAA